MQIRVLGPLEASVDDRPVAVGGAKQRAVLAMLGLEANRAVTADRLIEGLWGEHLPPSAAKMVQNYVWRLRKVLDDEDGAQILTRGRAYELRIDREQVDACRLERLVSEAVRGAEQLEPGNAARAALALFRGEPLADVADEPFANAEIRRLEELRRTAAELAIDADLAAGRHQELVGEIDALLADDPLREHVHGQRMLALYRCGRQAEALDAYRHARQTLVEEIGVEPSPELRRLHDAILRQDPSLDVEPAAVELARELDPSASPPLIGREDELRRLRARWQRAASGAGSLVTIVGAYGIGKTRIAAAIAGDAHREGAMVLYAAGTGLPEAALAAIARARESRRPALLVVDDADRAPTEVRVALLDVAPHTLVLATGQEAAPLARLDPSESLVLEPLDRESVRSIAAFYALAGDHEVPVDTLLATSRGVPRRVHEAASEWARREATRRVDAAADRAAAGRSEALALVDELAGSVVELQSTRERAGLAGPGAESHRVVCPYKGLATFESEDAEYFFGRERLVADLVARLVGAPLLAVVGPSGSGKSSVVRAGLLPALAGGVLPGSHTWTQTLIRPGGHPLGELRRATRRLARERRSVLAVDQFEELFTACDDEAERAEFAAALARSARDGTVVVLAVRADFYGRCAAYSELSSLVSANHVLVGAMSRDELAHAIERPAERVGLSVEPELVEVLLADVEGQPGALPLLSTALLELWRGRDGRRLRLAAYARSGGVEGAVARLAEDAYVHLDPGGQEVARGLLLRLTDEDEGGAVVRRRVALADLATEASEVASELADRRLLTVGDGAVEVAHEALLREWPRLRAWLDEDVHGRRVQRQLGVAARAWEADGRDPGGLYRGGRLAAALDWADAHAPELTLAESDFLAESRHAAGRAQRRLRMVLAGVAALLVLAVAAGALALDQRGAAREEATLAAAQGLGALALADDDLDHALLLARQGVALDDSPQTRSNLLAALLKSPAAIGVVAAGDRPNTLDLSPDGRTLAIVDADGTLRLIDTVKRRATARPQKIAGRAAGARGLTDVRFSDDGSRLAIGGTQPVVLNARTQRVVTRMHTPTYVDGFVFSPDGETLFAIVGGSALGSTAIQRYDVASGRTLGAPRFISGRYRIVSLMVTRDGRRAVTTFEGGPTVIRDAQTLRPLRRFPAGGSPAALSPDDRTMLIGGAEGTVQFLDLVTGNVRAASGRHDGAVVRASFSRDGHLAVTAGEDNRAIVWDVRWAAARDTFAGHAGEITGLAISPDARTLYTAAVDGKLLIWDLFGDRRFGRPFGIGPDDRSQHPDFPTLGHALSPDGRVLAIGHRDGTVTLVDARTLRERSTFRVVPRGPVHVVAWMPGGPLLAVGGDRGYLALVDPRRGHVVDRLRGPSGSLLACSFRADGRLMATLAFEDAVLLWRLEGGRPVGAPRIYDRSLSPTDASLSPDGRTLAVASGLGVEILDVATLRRRTTLTRDNPTNVLVRFTPDGRSLVVGSLEGSARVWSTESWRPISRPLGGHTGEVLWASVSPDSRTLATGSPDGTISLFDLRTQRSLGTPLTAVPNRFAAPLFTPDGAYLFGVTDAGRGFRWDVRPSAWSRHACVVAGRRLTRDEWRDALPARAYDPAC